MLSEFPNEHLQADAGHTRGATWNVMMAAQLGQLCTQNGWSRPDALHIETLGWERD